MGTTVPVAGTSSATTPLIPISANACCTIPTTLDLDRGPGRATSDAVTGWMASIATSRRIRCASCACRLKATLIATTTAVATLTARPANARSGVLVVLSARPCATRGPTATTQGRRSARPSNSPKPALPDAFFTTMEAPGGATAVTTCAATFRTTIQTKENFRWTHSSTTRVKERHF